MAQKKISSVLYESTTKLLMESGVTKIFSINRLINFALAETIPDILKELNPFPRMSQISLMTKEELYHSGFNVPFHTHCRCEIILEK